MSSQVEGVPTPHFNSLDEFVGQYLCNNYRRRIDGRNRCWAGEWWRYDEAVARLDAMWRAWEYLRLDGFTGVSLWFRDHADHHMPILMDPDGPFATATEGPNNTNRPGEPLPHVPPPPGWFPPVTGPADPA